MLQAIAGYDASDPGSANVPVPDFSERLALRCRWVYASASRASTSSTSIEPEVERLVREADRRARPGSARASKRCRLPHVGHAQVAGNVIMSRRPPPGTRPGCANGPTTTAPDVLAAHPRRSADPRHRLPASQQMRTLIQHDFRQAFQHVDVVVAPTVPLVAPPIGRTQEPGGPLQLVPRAVANRATVPCNLTGMPAISVPCGFGDGLPVGLQIMGTGFRRAAVLRSRAAYESATDWRRPRAARLSQQICVAAGITGVTAACAR